MEWLLLIVLGAIAEPLDWAMEALRERSRKRGTPLTLVQVRRHHLIGLLVAAIATVYFLVLTVIFAVAHHGGLDWNDAYTLVAAFLSWLSARSARRRWRRWRESTHAT